MEASTTGQLVDNSHDGHRKNCHGKMSNEVEKIQGTLQAIRTQLAWACYTTVPRMDFYKGTPHPTTISS